MGKRTYDKYNVSSFPDEFKMILPDGYRIDIEYDDDGNEVPHLRGGFYINDDGEEDFNFSCAFIGLTVDVRDREDLIKQGKAKDYFVPGLILEQVAISFMESQEEQFGKGVRLNLYNSYPASTIMKFYKPITIFGATLDTFIVFYYVEITENLFFGLHTVYQGGSERSEQFYKHFLNVIKAVRVSEKTIDIGKLTPKKLEKALDMDADGSVGPLDLGLKININFNYGDEKHQYTFNNDGSITNHSTGFKYADPDEKLFPHYNTILRTQNMGMPGVTVLVNQSGTEYQFFNLKEDLSEDASDEKKEAVSRLTDPGASGYTLADRAIEMRALFHVNPDVFDSGHDRECELAEGLMHRAYMMSALRSFGWTLYNYCDEKRVNPGEIGRDKIYEIIEAVADENWLNYNDKTVCRGLCGTQDLHVYYLPDNTSDELKSVFLPSQETIDETRRIQKTLPSYNPILEQVGSLDELRKDLVFIGDAVQYIYDELKENRDYSQPLVGNDADILYAWCALAYAARGPFFTEDGPMNCYFTQLPADNDSLNKTNKPGEKSARQETSQKDQAEKEESSAAKSRSAGQSLRNFSTWGFKVTAVPANRKKLINISKGYPIRFLPHSAVQTNWQHDMNMFQYYCSLHFPEYFDNVNIIIEHAEKYSTIFSADGTSADIKAGKLRNSAPIHALRSFIWSACEIQEGKVKSNFPSDAPEEMWFDLAAFIGLHGYANYSPANKKAKRFGAALLRKEEVRSVYTDGCGFDNSQCLYQDETIGKTMSNASINSLIQLVDVLSRTMPIMDFYYTSLEAESDYSNGTVEAMRMILEGWMTFAFACRQPFFIVPEKYCTEDKDMSSALTWAIAPEMDETNDGIFTLCGTEIVKANNCAQEVIIPDSVTGMIVSEDTIAGLNRAFRNTRRIVYPESYTGAIVIPPNVREIEVLGDPEIITTKRLSDDIPRLETLTFLGRPKSVGSKAFEFLNSLDKIILPEGVEKLYDEAFYGWCSHGEIFLPESLNSIDDNVFNEFRMSEDVTIYVSKACPAKNTIVKQLADHKNYWDEQNRKYPDYSRNRKYRIKLIEQESPWSICANLFIKRLDYLYDGLDNPEATPETVKEILEETIGGYDYFIKCKEFIIKKAGETNRTELVELILNSNDDLQLYETLPEKLAEDIKKYQAEKALNNAKKDLRDAEEEISRSEVAIHECEKAIEKDKKILEEKKKALIGFKESKGKEFEEEKLRITTGQDSLRTAISKLANYISELKKELEDTQKELDHTSFFKFSRKKELASKIEELDSEIKNSNDKLSKENARLAALNAEYNNKTQIYQQALAQLNKEISDCIQRINTNNSRISSLQRVIDDQRRTVIELKDKMRHFEEAQNTATKAEKSKKAEEDLLAKIEAEIGGRFRSRIRDKFSKKSLKKKEDKKPKEHIKENEKLVLEDLLGWKPLPLNDSGVLEGQETDNELRELIQLIDFSKLNN